MSSIVICLLSNHAVAQPRYNGSEVVVVDSSVRADPSVAIKLPTSQIKALSGSNILSSGAAMLYPSLDVRSYGSLGGVAFATYRGLPAEFVTIEYNGVRLNTAQNSLSDLGLVDLNVTSSVMLSSSTSNTGLSGDIGNARLSLSGIQGLASKTTVIASTELTSYSEKVQAAERVSSILASVPISDVVSVAGAFSNSGTNGDYPFYQSSTHETILRSNNDASLTNGSVSLTYKPSDSLRCDVFSLYTKSDRGAPGANTVDYYGNSSFARQFDELYLLGASLEQKVSERFFYIARLAYESQFETYNDSILSIADRYTNRSLTASVQTRTTLSALLNLYADVSADRNALASNEDVAWGTTDISRMIVRSNIGLGYAPLEALSVDAHFKVEHYSDIHTLQVLPHFQIQYFFDFWQASLIASYTKLYHAPTFNELYWKIGGNPNLKPEAGNGYELTADISPIERWNIKATGYLNEIDNQIVWVPGSVWSPDNVERVRSYGVELTSSFSYPIDEIYSIDLRGGLMLQHTVNLTEGSINYGNELIYSTPLRWNVAVTGRANYIGQLTLGIIYRGHRYTDFANNGKLQPVGVTNVTFRSVPIKLTPDLS
ncbi:MAG TPA: TonB-dependent receptor, partial [Candidatus Kapabacteria bacterium]|nr:TonB-dependent receptor [Candidatus Kapabacteria bacterium]